MSIIQVAYFPSNNNNAIPSWITNEMHPTKPMRLALAEVVLALPETSNSGANRVGKRSAIEVIHSMLLRGEIEYYKFKPNSIYVLDPQTGYPFLIKVAEVDTSRQWQVRCIEGEESIEYLNIEVVNESLNQYRW